jgi:hypothetical protein
MGRCGEPERVESGVSKINKINFGVTVKGIIAVGTPGANASAKKDSWETPDGMNAKAVFRRLCDMGQAGKCPRCQVRCRFGERWMKLGMPEGIRKESGRSYSKAIAYPAIAKQLEKMKITVAELSRRVNMSESKMWNRMRGETKIRPEEAKDIWKALKCAVPMEEMFRKE